ncbi:GNAT family N-acetyltransferase [Demequina sp. NBRC 110057]|uniref:GNAT family N-acetyltransferase n=1 Tax=Demequina sp. NBRC 110057 TaxID=1570346 RepID=UPI0009FDDA65|nr:GNAT family N-acetyltransferase [Demequina sp. NBRC 110057]
MTDGGPHDRPPCAPLSDAAVSLEPLREDHAEEMVQVLAAPELYRFTGGAAPSLAELRQRYVRQSRGLSPSGDEAWLNWLVRDRASREALGYVQATVALSASQRTASVAWVVAPAHQGRGIATRAARLMVSHLESDGVRAFSASIADGHTASERVATRLGMRRTEELDDGEVVWRR